MKQFDTAAAFATEFNQAINNLLIHGVSQPLPRFLAQYVSEEAHVHLGIINDVRRVGTSLVHLQVHRTGSAR